MPTFGTVCDGIGCGHLAFNRAGFDCAWSFEIDAFPSAVLAYRFPDVKNHGDMLKCVGMIESGEIAAPDVFIGGTPCQAFSVAGKRKGLEDARGNLSLTFCVIADAIDDVRGRDGKPPCAVLWENVPGVLSDKGNAFGCFLGELSGAGCQLQPAGGRWRNAGCVFGPKRTVAWRVLDSQFFGVAQRRRRVFVVASAGDGFRPEEVLFEREGVRRDSAPSREKREGASRGVEIGPSGGCFTDLNPTLDARCKDGPIRNQLAGAVLACHPSLTQAMKGSGLVPTFRMTAFGEYSQDGTASTLKQRDYKDATDLIATYDMRGNGDGETVGTLTGDHAGRPTDYTPVVVIQERACAPDLNCGPGGQPSIELNPRLRADTNTGDGAPCVAFGGEIARTLSARHDSSPCADRGMDVVAQGMQVRRLTPRECERLQALPDDWAKIPWRGKPIEECPDGPRYKAIGNGQTVTVMEWLARRIMAEMTR